jgi:hypothetical protein
MQNRKRSMKRSASRSASMRGGESTLPVGNVVGNPNSLSASSGAIVGGRRHRRHRRRGGSSHTRKQSRKQSRKQRGGFLHGMGLAATIKEALVPFGLFALQKRTQRRRKY